MTPAQRIDRKNAQTFAQLPYLPRTLGLMWHVAKPWTIRWIVLLVVEGVLPAASVYLTSWLG